MPINWQDGSSGGTPLSAANLNRLAVTADIGTTGTPTGDALRAALGPVPTNTQYVRTDGNDSRDGLSWATAKATISAAVAALTGDTGLIEIAGGDYHETVTLANNYTWLRAHGHSRAGGYGARIIPPTNTASGLVVRGAGCVIQGVCVMSTSTSYKGTLIDHQAHGCHYSDVHLDNADNAATATTGGVGLRMQGSEGNLFERLSINESNTAIYLVDEATENVFIATTLSSCWVDLKSAGASGSNNFLRLKGTFSRNDGSSPVLDLNGSGENTLQDLDLDEAVGGAVTASVASSRNTFIGCVTSPQTTVTISGSNNVFINQKVLKAFTVTGSANKVEGIYLPAGATLTDNGTASIIQGVNAVGGTYTPAGGATGTRAAVLTTQTWARPRATGRWYANSFGSFMGDGGIGTGTGNASLIYAGGPATWDQISLEVTVADAAAVLRLSVYDVDPDTLLPVNLLLDAGTVTGAATGSRTITFGTPLKTTGLWVAGAVTVTAQGSGLSLRGMFPQAGEFAPFGFANPTLNARSGISPSAAGMGTGAAKPTWGNTGFGGQDYGVMLHRSA